MAGNTVGSEEETFKMQVGVSGGIFLHTLTIIYPLILLMILFKNSTKEFLHTKHDRTEWAIGPSCN